MDEPAEDVVAVEETAPPLRVDELLVQLRDRPRNYKARLEVARLFCAEGEWDAAMDHYQKLVSARKFLPAVIDDLTPLAGEPVDLARLYQLQGDALMEDDRLDDALEMYRKAKQALTQR
jgi:tetratricopeptide (TPR) repeat protein